MNQPRDFSLHGAIDLGARQAAAQRRQRAAEQGAAAGGQPGGQSGLIIDVTDETFNTDVVARSRTVPVVLDLWAEWCGPCKQLGPILEKLATEANGAFVLARVDVDANPQLSAALQVQSIPMVVAVVGRAGRRRIPRRDARAAGQGVARPGHAGCRATGLRPAERRPAGRRRRRRRRRSKRGSPATPDGLGERRTTPCYAEAQEAMERGDLNAAEAAFEKVLAADPGDPVATMGLGQVGLIRRVECYDQAAARRDADEPAR